MLQIITAVVGSAIMIFLTIDLFSQWKSSSKSTRRFSDLVIQWFFWLIIILLIVASL
ncbi:hypothetical protein N9795_01615 [Candidatus Pelagibacter sp.]|nr:hypothetical protein [Candidatus Pelagibacter sp.]